MNFDKKIYIIILRSTIPNAYNIKIYFMKILKIVIFICTKFDHDQNLQSLTKTKHYMRLILSRRKYNAFVQKILLLKFSNIVIY
jgi:hypothetical protein